MGKLWSRIPRCLCSPLLLVLAGGAGCTKSTGASTSDGGVCTPFFGRPNALTGLSADQCSPTCGCGSTAWTAPDYSPAFSAALITDWTLTAPYPPITVDPYASPAPPDDPPGTVCAVLSTGTNDAGQRLYVLNTYASEDAAHGAGASPTHFGHCGVCSTLANLAVYMQVNDLTAPVRACGINSSTEQENINCLQVIGFDLPCSQIYYFNTVNTRSLCLSPCLSSLGQPYNLPDGGLNDCLRCDETESGPVFKAVAGRTRRNSGLANALCRPCGEVQPLLHDY